MKDKLIDNGFNVIDNLMTEEQLIQSDAIYRKELRQFAIRKCIKSYVVGFVIGSVIFFITVAFLEITRVI